MALSPWLIFLKCFVLAAYICLEGGASFTNFKIKRIENCNNTQREIKYSAHITNRNDKQYFYFNATIPYSLGDNIGGVCVIETKAIGNNFVELFTIREKNACKALNKYWGEFWYDIQRGSRLAIGVCPIQQGVYRGNHIELHYEKISLQTFPFGTLRFTMQLINNSNKNCVMCIIFEVDNIVN